MKPKALNFRGVKNHSLYVRCQKYNYIKLPRICPSLITWFLRTFHFNTKSGELKKWRAICDEFMSGLWAALINLRRRFFHFISEYFVFLFSCHLFYSVLDNSLMARNTEWWTDLKHQQPRAENTYELHAYQFLGVWLWRNYDNDDKKTRLRQVKIESKIDFRGIVWKIVSLSTFTVKN